MRSLIDAIEAADRRKLASFGIEDLPDNNSVIVSGGEPQDRAVFYGFDIDYDELVHVASRVGTFFASAASTMELLRLFTSAWTDGLLVGLYAATLPPHPPGDDGHGEPDIGPLAGGGAP